MVKRKRILLLVGFLSLFLALGGLWRYLKQLDYFNLRRVEISTEGQVSKEEVVALSGVRLGQNIFTIDLEEVRKRLESHPWVARAFVSRKLPHAVFIKIEEERPIAMVARGRQVFLVNEAGELFALATPEWMKELPALMGLSEEELKSGRLSPERKGILTLLVRLKREEALVPCYANLSQIKLLDDGFLLLTRDAIQIRFKGESFKEFWAAYRRLDAILAYLYRTKQYTRVKAVRLDYPEGQAALVFRKG